MMMTLLETNQKQIIFRVMMHSLKPIIYSPGEQLQYFVVSDINISVPLCHKRSLCHNITYNNIMYDSSYSYKR